MTEFSATAARAFHLTMRDNEEGGLHYAHEIEPYFSLPTDVIESLGTTIGDFAQSLVNRDYHGALSSGSDDVGMAPWFEVDELPLGSTVPQLIESREELEAFLIRGYRNACCIGWE